MMYGGEPGLGCVFLHTKMVVEYCMPLVCGVLRCMCLV